MDNNCKSIDHEVNDKIRELDDRLSSWMGKTDICYKNNIEKT
jgi:hypothetical protein